MKMLGEWKYNSISLTPLLLYPQNPLDRGLDVVAKRKLS
jgi:hypothetical protein